MTTSTFITIIAWILSIYCGLVVAVNLPLYLKLKTNTKGSMILLIWVVSLWWLFCEH